MSAKRMKLGWIILFLVLIAMGISTRFRPHDLTGVCPAITRGDFTRIVLVSDVPPLEIEANITDEQLLSLLTEAQIIPGREFSSTPAQAFEIRVRGDSGDYSLVIGNDGSVSLAEYRDLSGTRTYWRDPSGALFANLYACHTEGDPTTK